VPPYGCVTGESMHIPPTILKTETHTPDTARRKRRFRYLSAASQRPSKRRTSAPYPCPALQLPARLPFTRPSVWPCSFRNRDSPTRARDGLKTLKLSHPADWPCIFAHRRPIGCDVSDDVSDDVGMAVHLVEDLEQVIVEVLERVVETATSFESV
jgi:hypothetical protein